MSDAGSKHAIDQALKAFAAQPLKAAATGLFTTLGYTSKKTRDLKQNGVKDSYAPTAAATSTFIPTAGKAPDTRCSGGHAGADSQSR